MRKPGRYLEGEVNAAKKPWDEARVRFCLVYPDLYEIGMSHIGLLILYLILNSRTEYLADRAFAPARDLEAELRARGLPLLSLEHGRPLRDFEVVGISYPYELCATNILTVLELSGIPLLSKERTEGDPLILGGGSAMANPEPVADFYDAIVFGDGEEAILEIAETVREWKEARGSRAELLKALSRLPGVYVPSFFRPRYDSNGRLAEIEPLRPGYERVFRRIVSDLDAVPYPFRPPVPWFAAHDRLSLEISRGCTRGCRFCQASSLYRPVRERSVERVLAMAEEGLSATGYEEISLLSLSAGDYTGLEALVRALYRRFGGQRISLSLPSLRVGSLTPGILEVLSRGRRTGLTLAPEAGTERLRRVINKDISEEELLRGAELARSLGWRDVKLYFMIGLPTETEEDLRAIAELARRVRRAGKGIAVTVSVSTFVPKPHTPFQWERQIDLSETKEKLTLLKKLVRGRGLSLKWHLPEQSFLEGVLSRGDRRLSALILRAFREGARLDGWSEEFRLSRWQNAARALGLDLSAYLRERHPEEVLPWEHLDCGLSREFLLEERARALSRKVSPDCRFVKCLKCGVCKGGIRNVLHGPPEDRSPLPDFPLPDAVYWYRVVYAREGPMRFLSQRELQRVLERALRRAGLPLSFTRGFSPRPRLSFGRALPVGVASEAEVFFVALSEEWPEERIRMHLERELPQGLRLREVRRVPSPRRAEDEEALFEVALKEDERIEELPPELSPWVIEMKIEGNRLYFRLRLSPGAPRPEEAAARLLGLPVEEVLARGIKRIA